MYVVAGRMRDNQLRSMWKTLRMENRGKKENRGKRKTGIMEIWDGKGGKK